MTRTRRDDKAAADGVDERRRRWRRTHRICCCSSLTNRHRRRRSALRRALPPPDRVYTIVLCLNFFHRCCNYNFCRFCYHCYYCCCCYRRRRWVTLYFGYENRFVIEPRAQRRHTVVSRSRSRDGFRFGSAAAAGCTAAAVIASTFDRRRGRVIAAPPSAPRGRLL